MAKPKEATCVVRIPESLANCFKKEEGETVGEAIDRGFTELIQKIKDLEAELYRLKA